MSIIDKIKLLFTLNSAVNQIKEAKMKDGIFTTEFWGVVGSTVFTLWGAFGGLIGATMAAEIIAGVVTAYAILRTLLKLAELIVKLTPSTKDDEALAKIEAGVDAVTKPFAGNIPIDTPK